MESVRALKPFSIKLAEPLAEPLQRRLFYFEVTVKELGRLVGKTHINILKLKCLLFIRNVAKCQ
jgi:hypothetical protein